MNKTLIALGAIAFMLLGKKEPPPNNDPSLNPCDGVDCGDFGWCVNGDCSCGKGYSGMNCEYAPGDPGSTDNPIITTNYT